MAVDAQQEPPKEVGVLRGRPPDEAPAAVPYYNPRRREDDPLQTLRLFMR